MDSAANTRVCAAPGPWLLLLAGLRAVLYIVAFCNTGGVIYVLVSSLEAPAAGLSCHLYSIPCVKVGNVFTCRVVHLHLLGPVVWLSRHMAQQARSLSLAEATGEAAAIETAAAAQNRPSPGRLVCVVQQILSSRSRSSCSSYLQQLHRTVFCVRGYIPRRSRMRL